MKMGAAPYRAVNGLFSVGVEAIFIAVDLSGLGLPYMSDVSGSHQSRDSGRAQSSIP